MLVLRNRRTPPASREHHHWRIIGTDELSLRKRTTDESLSKNCRHNYLSARRI